MERDGRRGRKIVNKWIILIFSKSLRTAPHARLWQFWSQGTPEELLLKDIHLVSEKTSRCVHDVYLHHTHNVCKLNHLSRQSPLRAESRHPWFSRCLSSVYSYHRIPARLWPGPLDLNSPSELSGGLIKQEGNSLRKNKPWTEREGGEDGWQNNGV